MRAACPPAMVHATFGIPNLEPNPCEMEAILADASVSVTELKRNPSVVIEAADGEAVAVLVYNKAQRLSGAGWWRTSACSIGSRT